MVSFNIYFFSFIQSTQRGMDRRIVAQLFDSIDFISSLGNKSNSPTIDGVGGGSTVDQTVVDSNKQNIADAVTASMEGGDKLSTNSISVVEGLAPKKSNLVVLIAATNK